MTPRLGHRFFLGWAASVSCLPAAGQSLEFVVNGINDHEYALLSEIPGDFGAGEFSLDLWIRPDDTLPIGTFSQGEPDQLIEWSLTDPEPYSSDSWWFRGNFLLDGHNNADFSAGTFSVQFYGGGRVRWLFGDGSSHWAVQVWPATETPSLLDGDWHRLTLVRRWVGASDADLELWVDGSLAATETTSARTDMRTYWNSWSGFPGGQEGWFFGSEKQAAIGVLSQYEDYKGLLDEILFYNRALSGAEIAARGTVPGLVAAFSFFEGAGSEACEDFLGDPCLQLVNFSGSAWNALDATEGSGGGGGGGGGCLIATAAYGTPLATELSTLRDLRDRMILTNAVGAAFCNLYYHLSPPAAHWIAARPAARAAVRAVLAFGLRLNATGLLLVGAGIATGLIAHRRTAPARN